MFCTAVFGRIFSSRGLFFVSRGFRALFLVALLAGCSPDSVVPVSVDPPETGKETVRVSGVVLDRGELTLKVGEAEALGAAVKPSNADNKAVSWSSGDGSVVRVSSDGLVVGLAAGVSVVSVRTLDGAFTAECVVKVEAASSGDDPDDGDDDEGGGEPGDGGDDGEGGGGSDPDPDPDDPTGPDDPPAAPTSGSVGALNWIFSVDDAAGGVLTISGDGVLPDYDDPADATSGTDAELAPWSAHNPKMVKVVIGEGVARIGDHCFTEDYALVDVMVMAATPPSLGEGNFPVWGDTLHVPAGSVPAYQAAEAWYDAFYTIDE